MEINQRVKFYISQDDSDYASNCFGVEPQNDWFDIQFYPEQIEGIIIWNKHVILAQQVYKTKDGEARGNIYDISKRGVKERINYTRYMLDYYNMKESLFFDCQDDDFTFDRYYQIETVS